MPMRARFKGPEDAFIPGVPARHLSDEEFDALSTEQRAHVRASDLYDVKTEAEMAAKSHAAEKEPAKASAPKAETTKGGEG